MNVIANGKPIALPDGATVSDLVARLGFGQRWVVVERNGDPVARSRFASTSLADGDRLEVVRPVQGGEAVNPADRRSALDRARLYLVADATLPDAVLRDVLAAGVDVVQLRCKEATDLEILTAGERFRAAAREARVPFVVNDRPDLAWALEADGVHLGQDDLPPAHARRLLGPDVLIGRSTHDEGQVLRAIAEHDAGEIDYCAVGPVHATPTKPGRPAVGHELVRFAAARIRFPWFAIGGIDPDNLPPVAEAGARRIVVVRAITRAPDPVAAVARLLDRLPCP